MKSIIKVALVGDFDATITAHNCIPEALKISANIQAITAHAIWISTTDLKNLGEKISEFDGVWCVPGSPYKNRAAVLDLIKHARTTGIPYLGTCGGYQHAILEYAQNVLGYTHAELEEENPTANMPLISALSCRLVDEDQKITIEKNSKLHSILESNEIYEEYRCGFGMNPKYMSIFNESSLKFVASNEEKIPQAFELNSHPFFIGTAFQPERSSRQGLNHPLIAAFIQAMLPY